MYGTTLMTAALLPFQKARMPSSPDQSGAESKWSKMCWKSREWPARCTLGNAHVCDFVQSPGSAEMVSLVTSTIQLGEENRGYGRLTVYCWNVVKVSPAVGSRIGFAKVTWTVGQSDGCKGGEREGTGRT